MHMHMKAELSPVCVPDQQIVAMLGYDFGAPTLMTHPWSVCQFWLQNCPQFTQFIDGTKSHVGCEMDRWGWVSRTNTISPWCK